MTYEYMLLCCSLYDDEWIGCRCSQGEPRILAFAQLKVCSYNEFQQIHTGSWWTARKRSLPVFLLENPTPGDEVFLWNSFFFVNFFHFTVQWMKPEAWLRSRFSSFFGFSISILQLLLGLPRICWLGCVYRRPSARGVWYGRSSMIRRCCHFAVIRKGRIINMSLLSWAWWHHGVFVLGSLFKKCFQWYIIDDVSPRWTTIHMNHQKKKYSSPSLSPSLLGEKILNRKTEDE